MNPEVFTLEQALREVERLRNAIRYHRDQRGDDRCWLDDQKLYEVLPETVPAETQLPPREKFLNNCSKFWECRQATPYKKVDELYSNWSEDKPY